jgi:starvation-inducible DNA-binding protein
MHKTKNDLSENVRIKVIEVLSARLADSADLMLQAKQAHWNVKGPNFIALHELFDKIVDSAEDYMDLIAERVMQLGGAVEGTVRAVAKKSSLDEYPLHISDGRDHVDALSSALAKYGKAIRRGIDQADELGDKDTADLFTEVSRGVDKYLWFVEAHLG